MDGDFVYVPDQEQVADTNLMRFAARRGFKTIHELYQWADAHSEDFWREVISDCDITFYRGFSKVLDGPDSNGTYAWYQGGLINIVRNAVERYALAPETRDRYAIKFEDEEGVRTQITYGELDGMVGRLAGSLSSIGVGRGDRIGIYLPPTVEGVVALYSILRIGAVAVPIFSGYGREAVESRLKDAGARYIFTCHEYTRRGRRIMQSDPLASIPDLKIIMAGVDGHSDGILSMKQLIAEGKYVQSVPMNSEDPAIMLYTSGTTGRPKGTVHVHGGSFINIVKEVKYYMDLRSSDTMFWISDLGWMMGAWSIIGTNSLGGTIFLYSGAVDFPDDHRIYRLVEENGVSVLGLSPTLIRMLKSKGIGDAMPGVRVFGSTGEPWDTDSWMHLFQNIGGGRTPICNISGGTDIIGCFLASTPAIPLKPRCLYRGLGMHVSVFDDEGRDVTGQIGHLVAKGQCPSMTRGIWKQPEKYFETYWSRFGTAWSQGDWAEMDAEGYFFLYGRSDDVIKVAGKRLGPNEVEDIVNAVQGVVESAAVGIPDEIRGESLAIFYTGSDSEETRGAIRKSVESKLGKSFAPSFTIHLPALPKTRNGKIMRRIVKSSFLGEPVGDVSNLEDFGVVTLIGSIGKEVGGAHGRNN